ncbi:MAG: 30S ribosomal protein S3 [Candidatus Aenigmatarchaeota archaeon]
MMKEKKTQRRVKMKERIFIQKSKEHARLKEFIRNYFKQAKCGEIDVQYTPVAVRIIIHTTTPGIIIGSGGENIKEVIEIIKRDFGIENPQIDVQKIDNPDLDPNIIAQSIASSIESGVNYKRLGNYYVSRIMEAGAAGCEIIISGKISGEKARSERFVEGYLKKCGDPAERDVISGFAVANPKLGTIGVNVKIMLKHIELLKNLTKEEKPKEKNEEKEIETENVEEEK